MTESERIEEAGADTAPLSNVVKWVRAFVDVWRRRRPTPLAMVATVRPVGRDDEEQPLGELVSDPVPACQSTEATAEAAVEKSLARYARKRPKVEGKTMAKTKATGGSHNGGSKAKPRAKSKRKTTLPVLLLCGVALGMSACGVKGPSLTLDPSSPHVLDGSLPSVHRDLNAGGVTIATGDFTFNLPALLSVVTGFGQTLLGTLTGAAQPKVEPAQPMVATQ